MDQDINVFSKEYRARKSPKVEKPPKVRKAIRPMSKKLSKERDTYRQLREEFLKQPENMFCAVYPSIPSEEIHHSRGRHKYLNDVSTWIAVSRVGHDWIHANVALATERGFMKSRLALVKPLNEE
jgi:hypothetical protein